MALRPPPIKSVPAQICDWIELKILQTNKPFRLSILQRAWDTQRDTEDSDIEGRNSVEDDTDADGLSGQSEDRIIEAVSDEFGDRATALKQAYPFELNDTGTRVSLREELNSGQQTYLFCLFLTHVRSNEVVDGTWRPQVDNRTRDLFQACSTIAAAGEVKGHAISFGYPRPGVNARFLVRLKEVYKLLGDGSRVRDRPLPGASPSPKDGEIDIIAWQPSVDGAPGVRYLLGQVASGNNWEAKSIKGVPIANFHDNWFEVRPASEPEASIFIPHEILPSKTGNRNEVMAFKVREFGRVFDRRRLPLCVLEGKGVAERIAGATVERLDELPAIEAWIAAQINSLRAVQRA